MTSRGAEKMKNDTIGVDVSKDHLDAHRLADGATRRFANTKGGHKALIKWLTETPLYRVVFEPTGPYHRAVERALGIAGVPFVKVNPRQARRFAHHSARPVRPRLAPKQAQSARCSDLASQETSLPWRSPTLHRRRSFPAKPSPGSARPSTEEHGMVRFLIAA